MEGKANVMSNHPGRKDPQSISKDRVAPAKFKVALSSGLAFEARVNVFKKRYEVITVCDLDHTCVGL